MTLILNTDQQLKASILCDRLVWHDVSFRFEKVGAQYCVSVAERDVKRALEG